jgi:hypothetical protein
MWNNLLKFGSTRLLTFTFLWCIILPAEGQQLDSQSTYQEVSNPSPTELSPQPSWHIWQLDADGTLRGSIDGPPQTDGTSLSDNGWQLYLITGREIQHKIATDKRGRFSLPQVAPGPYSLVICGADGFTAHGVYLAPSSSSKFTNQIRPGIVSPQVPGFRAVLNENLPREVAAKITSSYDSSFEDVALAFNRSESGSTSQLSQIGSTAQLRQVMLERGKLSGRIGNMFGQAQDLRGIMVSIVQNGKRVTEAYVDDRGLFAIHNMQPGVYEFVAVGRQGFAAVRFNAVGDSVPMIDGSFQQPVGPITNSLDVCLTCRTAGVTDSPPNQTIPAKPKSSILQSNINTSGNSFDYGGYVSAHLSAFEFVGQ